MILDDDMNTTFTQNKIVLVTWNNGQWNDDWMENG